MTDAIERSTLRKVYARLLPVTLLIYFLCYIDRINVGFASLTMNKALGLSAEAYGFATGALFWGYCLFEVPSNLVLEKVGARLWLARIMITWGLLSGATAFCTGPWSYTLVRFLLGAAEAGLYPGVLLFFTYWFPDRHRARIFAGFTVALPGSVALGSPISTALMELDGLWGLAGWKWMFLMEAAPTVVVGCLLPFILTDRPARARWLSDAERDWLERTLAHERRQIEAAHTVGLLESFWNPRVLLLALNFLGIVTAALGLVIFMPQMIKQLGLTNMQVGWAGMIPYLCGCVSMALWGWTSDRMDERRWNLFAACVVAALGLIIAGLGAGTAWLIVGMSIAAIGIYGTKGPFWALPGRFLTGVTVAASLAFINSIGNLGGFFGPWIVGWVKDRTDSFAGGLYALAGFALLSAVISAFWLNIEKPAGLGESTAAPAE
ncbi:MAG TPA: MFS transporter [Stellaceae bacterium]|nr:MFS transporter [Stellaceae bacterium]